MNEIENEVEQAALSEKESSDSDNDHALDSKAAVFLSNITLKLRKKMMNRSFGVKMDNFGRL